MRTLSFFLLVASAVCSLPGQTPNDKGMLTLTSGGGQVSVGDAPSLLPATGSMTVEAWMRFQGATFSWPTIVRKPPGYPAYMLRINSSGTTVEGYINVNGTYVWVQSNVPSILGTWHHLACTYDATTVRLYFDGALVSQQLAPGILTNQPGPLVIGTGANFNENWNGSIDEVRLWSVARTAGQINADRFREFEGEPGLVSVWRMNGGFTDSIGANHGVATGSWANPVSTSPVIGNYVLAPPVVAIGSAAVFTVVASDAGAPYVFDVSASGSSPGLFLPPPVNVTIPLNPPWLNLDFGSLLPPGTISNFLGFVPMSHQAVPLIHIPADPSVVGVSLTSAFVSLDPGSAAIVKHVSAPKTTVIASFGPAVASVLPATSPQSGGAVVTITGSHFQAGAEVFFNGWAGSNVVVNGSDTITVTTPFGVLGPATVMVRNPNGLTGVLAGGITYVPDLVLTSITPAVAVPATTAVIAGSGFVAGLTLTIGAVNVTPANVTPTSISFTVPAGAPCDTTVGVMIPDLQTGSLPWNASPVINLGFNLQGSAGGGGNFFLLGAFTPGTTVSVGGAPATVTEMTPTALLAIAPAGAPGPATVVVSALSGCSATTSYLYQ